MEVSHAAVTDGDGASPIGRTNPVDLTADEAQARSCDMDVLAVVRLLLRFGVTMAVLLRDCCRPVRAVPAGSRTRYGYDLAMNRRAPSALHRLSVRVNGDARLPPVLSFELRLV